MFEKWNNLIDEIKQYYKIASKNRLPGSLSYHAVP